MAKYRVIAGAVPALHTNGRKKPEFNEILDESFFKEGEIGELLKGGFIKAEKEEAAPVMEDFEVTEEYLAAHPELTDVKVGETIQLPASEVPKKKKK
jgi:hypothetical protein